MTRDTAAGPRAGEPPIYVDLDGTLIHSDLLWESLLSALRRDPLAAVSGLARLAEGKAAMKRALAGAGAVEAGTLPFNAPFVDWLRAQADAGRQVWLATAAERRLAEEVAGHLGFFAGVLASDGRRNLKGPHKLAAIREHCGGGAFVYCGNGPEDVEIFAAASQAVVVAASPAVESAARTRAQVWEVFPRGAGGWRAWAAAVRPHQWLKNLLVFVPLLTSFRLDDAASVLAALGAFVCFGLVASGGYLVNDLLDLAADRRHPTKHRRPFASGRLPVPAGVLAAAVLFLAGLGGASMVSPGLAAWLAGYGILTLAYSVAIKRLAVFDLIALAALYTIRILAGGAAIGVEVSFWLLAFSVFLFFSLATVKRCAELVSMRARDVDRAKGRDYRASDLEVLKSLGTATSVAAVLVLALYVESAEIAHRYAAPRLLWLMLVALLAWLAHLWIVTARGGMHDDPLVFALRDRTSRWLVGAMIAAFGCAALLHVTG
jgi:4-hydroxybenzoate polyprenyltransferase/phosphoserine phosphatase